MRGQAPDCILQTTALVHELFIKLVAQQDHTWENRRHFYSVCALVMRQILVDAARHRKALRRGGEAVRVPLESVDAPQPERMEWEELDAVLERLAELHPRQAQIVAYRFFLGFQEGEIAELLQVSSKTVQRDWLVARAWLHKQLSGKGHDT
jgi:RNA polymerase sigma factor (TIGR02999 family)